MGDMIDTFHHWPESYLSIYSKLFSLILHESKFQFKDLQINGIIILLKNVFEEIWLTF